MIEPMIQQSTTTNTYPTPLPDGKFLHFLKEMPGWVVVTGMLIFFTAVWSYSHDDFIPRILDALIGALLGLVVSNRPRPTGSTNINTDTVRADELRTASIDQPTINAKTVMVENNKEKEDEV